MTNTNNTQSPWDEIAEYPSSAWRREVAENNTRLGYVEWAEHMEEMSRDAEDEEIEKLAREGVGPKGWVSLAEIAHFEEYSPYHNSDPNRAAWMADWLLRQGFDAKGNPLKPDDKPV